MNINTTLLAIIAIEQCLIITALFIGSVDDETVPKKKASKGKK